MAEEPVAVYAVTLEVAQQGITKKAPEMAEVAISLLRTLKAAGEKTGAVEAEGALHLRRTSRRTMDGNHESAATSILQTTSSISLPPPKLPAAAAISPAAGVPSSLSSSSVSGPILVASHGSHHPVAVAIPITISSPGAAPSANTAGITLRSSTSVNGGLPAISSNASSPAASPSRLSIRPPTPLATFPSPSGSSPGGVSGGPPSPPGPLGSYPSTSPFRRYPMHAHSPNGGNSTPYEALQLPHSHGSPLPLLFDPPVSLPAASGPTSAVSPTSVLASTAAGSPGGRPVSLSTAGVLWIASGPASGPSIAHGIGGLPSPASSLQIPSVLPSPGIRTLSSHNSFGGTVSNLVAAAAGGGGSGSSPLNKLHLFSSLSPVSGAPTSSGAIAAAAGGGSGSRVVRASNLPGSPFVTSLSAAVAVTPPLPYSPSPSSSSPIPGTGTGLLPSSTLRSGSTRGSLELTSLPLTMSATQAALQLQLAATAASSSSALQPLVYQRRPSRPSSARSVAGGCSTAPPDGLVGSTSSRRLSVNGGMEGTTLTNTGSQKLVLAAAHELQNVQHLLHSLNHSNQNGSSNGTGAVGGQSPSAPLQQLLPPPQMPGRHPTVSARGLSVTGSGFTAAIASTAGGSSSSSNGAVCSLTHAVPRDGRCSDPGSCGLSLAASAPPQTSDFGFPTPELSPGGRTSLAPLSSAALQAVRATTPAIVAAATAGGSSAFSVLGWPHVTSTPSSPQPNVWGPRPDPLPPTAAAEALQPKQEPLPPLVATATAGVLPVKAPLGRTGTLAPLTMSDDVLPSTLAMAAGPVAESALDSGLPDMDPVEDPAALFRNGCEFGCEFELTVRAMASQQSKAQSLGDRGGKCAVQSSVRQRLQEQPLHFHPQMGVVATSLARRPSGGLDPLEATPRLILGRNSGGRVETSKLRPLMSAGGGELWLPSQGILPHLIGRVSSNGSSYSDDGNARLSCSPSTPASTSLSATASAASGSGQLTAQRRGNFTGSHDTPVQLSSVSSLLRTPGGSEVLLMAPRLRDMSGSGAMTAFASVTSPPQQLPSSRPLACLQSSYLQALATAAGLDEASRAISGSSRSLQRQRSLSDSSGATVFTMAAVDGGLVGLPVEGGLPGLSDLWSRMRAERNHNMRYCGGTAAELGGGGGGLDTPLYAAMVAKQVATARDDQLSESSSATAASPWSQPVSTGDMALVSDGTTAACARRRVSSPNVGKLKASGGSGGGVGPARVAKQAPPPGQVALRECGSPTQES